MDGQLVLDDPDALAVSRAVSKHNCGITYEQNRDRIRHFARRIQEKGLTPADVVIVVLNVDTGVGGLLANGLMPGHNWQEYRDRGEVPYARGLASRAGILEIVEDFDPEAGKKMRENPGVITVVVDYGVVEVYFYGEDT